jgi:coniferyl-aldehyde dehydrogenase
LARNDFGVQMIPSAAPFRGVGRSEIGAYHFKAGFDAFGHYRTVVGTDLPFSIARRRERGVAHDAPPAQEPLIACSLAHR